MIAQDLLDDVALGMKQGRRPHSRGQHQKLAPELAQAGELAGEGGLVCRRGGGAYHEAFARGEPRCQKPLELAPHLHACDLARDRDAGPRRREHEPMAGKGDRARHAGAFAAEGVLGELHQHGLALARRARECHAARVAEALRVLAREEARSRLAELDEGSIGAGSGLTELAEIDVADEAPMARARDDELDQPTAREEGCARLAGRDAHEDLVDVEDGAHRTPR